MGRASESVSILLLVLHLIQFECGGACLATHLYSSTFKIFELALFDALAHCTFI